MATNATIENGSSPGRLTCTLCSQEFPAADLAAHEANKLHLIVKIREDAREQIKRAVAATNDSLNFAPPEVHEVHLNRLAQRCVQIGIDLADALTKAGVPS